MSVKILTAIEANKKTQTVNKQNLSTSILKTTGRVWNLMVEAMCKGKFDIVLEEQLPKECVEVFKDLNYDIKVDAHCQCIYTTISWKK